MPRDCRNAFAVCFDHLAISRIYTFFANDARECTIRSLSKKSRFLPTSSELFLHFGGSLLSHKSEMLYADYFFGRLE